MSTTFTTVFVKLMVHDGAYQLPLYTEIVKIW